MKSRVVVAAVVEKGDMVLLGRKPKGVNPYKDTWLILGGGLDLENETAEQAIRREIREEAGIEVGELHQVCFDEDYEPDKQGVMTHFLFLIFRAEVLSGEPVPGDDITELRWFKKSELKDIKINRASKKLFRLMDLI